MKPIFSLQFSKNNKYKRLKTIHSAKQATLSIYEKQTNNWQDDIIIYL